MLAGARGCAVLSLLARRAICLQVRNLSFKPAPARNLLQLRVAARAISVQAAQGQSSSSESNQSSWFQSKAFKVGLLAAAAAAGVAVSSLTASSEQQTLDTPYVPRNKDLGQVTSVDPATLPIIALDEVRKHRYEGSIWVTYNGLVYDVTDFAEHHPGGKELILTAAGLDLSHFFENYTVHSKTDKASDYLKSMVIGRLSDEDAALAKIESTPEKHVERRLQVLGRARFKMIFVVATLPIWMILRTAFRIIGFIVPPLVHGISYILPVSIPGYGGARRLRPVAKDNSQIKVAVIGGGIAGSGAAYTLAESGFSVTLFEAREQLSGNAHTFDWKMNNGDVVKSCVSVTAWPPNLYKNYVALLNKLDVETSHIPLSWFLYSKVPGAEGYLWAADPAVEEGSLRKRFEKDFRRYGYAQTIIKTVTTALTFQWGQEESMYSLHSGLGIFNPLAILPLHHLCRMLGVSQKWWDVVFTPHYTASFLTDKLDNMCSVVAPILEANIPINPTEQNAKNCVLTTCQTWAKGGAGIRETFEKMTRKCDVRTGTRVVQVEMLNDGRKAVHDEFGNKVIVDKVVFACPANAVGNMIPNRNWYENTIFSTPEYADDHHPATGHMHAIMHSDAGLIDDKFREEVVKRASNYVEVTEKADGSINIENSYNFGVQTPGVNAMDVSEKPPMLISHALGDGKTVDPELVRGEGNHARAHPLYSGWNVATVLSLRLVQGRRGMYYCANYTTPGNCHDMSLLSGIACAHAIGADYPFPENKEARKDFNRLRALMGI